MASRGSNKHWCKICNTSFTSERALVGHMSCHRQTGKLPKGTPIPPTVGVDLHEPLPGPCDEKPLLTSLETLSRGHMKIDSEKKVLAMAVEEPTWVMEASSNAVGDPKHDEMLFSPVRRKRSKRGMPVLKSEEMDAALSLLLHSDKTSADEGCCAGDMNNNSSATYLLEDVNMNLFYHKLVEVDEFKKPKTENNSAYGDLTKQSEKENKLNCVPDVPEVMLLNVSSHALGGDVEIMKPEADDPVEELKSDDLPATVNVKGHQCSESFPSSGSALGCHPHADAGMQPKQGTPMQ